MNGYKLADMKRKWEAKANSNVALIKENQHREFQITVSGVINKVIANKIRMKKCEEKKRNDSIKLKVKIMCPCSLE